MINNFIKSKLVVFVLTIMFTSQSFAQKNGLFSRKNVLNQYATVGIGGGSTHYFGDLAPYRHAYHSIYTNVRWNAHINYTRYLTSKMAAKVSYSFVRLYGDDNTFSVRNFDKLAANYIRNLHFRNDLQEFTLSGLYNILPQYGKGAKGRANYMPYVSVGLGLFGHNPKARGKLTDDSDSFIEVKNNKPVLQKWQSLKNFRTEAQGLPGIDKKPYSLVQPVMPIAIGIRIKLNNSFDFTAEAGLRLTTSDYIDDVGAGNYPSEVLLSTNGFGSDFSYRAAETYSASTGKIRVFKFQEAVPLFQNGVSGTGVEPGNNAKTIYPLSSSFRGSGKPDSYIMTQFTISYVLSNHIKCPPIR